MNFKILRTYGEDGALWESLIQKLHPDNKDIHFLPQYARIYENIYNVEALLAFYGNDDEYIIQPVIKRDLINLPFLHDQEITDHFYDIANPYGYGGPVYRCSSTHQLEHLFSKFYLHFSNYCDEERIASEFASIHPFFDSRLYIEKYWNIQLHQEKEIVYIDLSLNEADIWKEIRKGHRSSIRKGQKYGIQIEKMQLSTDNLDIFKQLYFKTMHKKKAEMRWFFPEDYFRSCRDQLGEQRISLFFSFTEENVSSAFFLMHDFNTIYYHFSGSDNDFMDLGQNNLLMYEVIRWGRSRRYRRFHLGGGVTSSSDDSLFRFKSGFSSLRLPLYSYGRIHNKQVYDYLCILKKEHERQTTGKVLNFNYFPLYRRT